MPSAGVYSRSEIPTEGELENGVMIVGYREISPKLIQSVQQLALLPTAPMSIENKKKKADGWTESRCSKDTVWCK
ncbi:unnamed protein product [Boreogadus saida]